MLVNEVCKECNLTKKAIEYYVEQGLISPTIMKNGYRHFTDSDVSKLRKIAILRSLGLSVPDIRAVLENGGSSIISDVLNKRELEIVGLQEKQELLKQLAAGADWEDIRKQTDALQKKQSILNRILDKFPGYYGKFVCSHFSLYLNEPIVTDKQQKAFDTIICFLDGVDITIPEDLYEYLEEMERSTNATIVQNVSEALAGAVKNPEQYIRENEELLEQYQTIISSDEYKASPTYRLQEFLKQLQRENGYNDIFIPAMQQLSQSYREYYEKLLEANEIFKKKYQL